MASGITRFPCSDSFAGKPVVVRGAAADWPALKGWSLASLRDRFGSSVRNRVPDVGEPLFNEHGEVVARYDPAVHGESSADPSAHIQWQVRNSSISLELQHDYDTPAFLAGIQSKGVFDSEHGNAPISQSVPASHGIHRRPRVHLHRAGTESGPGDAH